MRYLGRPCTFYFSEFFSKLLFDDFIQEVGIFTTGEEFLVVWKKECHKRSLRYSTTELVNIPRHFNSHEGCTDRINHLKTKRRPLYLKTQSVPRCKHFSSRL